MNTIAELRSIPGLRLECPACLEKFKIGSVSLFDSRGQLPDQAAAILSKMKSVAEEQRAEILEREREIRERREELDLKLKNKPATTLAKTAGINFGQIVEKIVPSFGGFPYNPKDCRQLFEPIDYIVFKDLSKGTVDSIDFVDIKTGSSRLNQHQKSIKQVIEDGKVSFSILGGQK